MGKEEDIEAPAGSTVVDTNTEKAADAQIHATPKNYELRVQGLRAVAVLLVGVSHIGLV